MAQSMIFSRLMYANESTYGIAVTRDQVLPKVQSVSPGMTFNRVYSRGLGEGLNVVASNNVSYDSSLSGSFLMTPTGFDFFAHFVGPKTGAGIAGDPYIVTEATSVSSSDLASFSAELSNAHPGDNYGILFSGGVGDTLSFTGAIGQPLSVDFGAVAQKDVGLASPTSYTPNTEDPFMMIGGTFKWGSTPSSLSGVRAFSLSYSNGLITGDDTRDLNTIFISQPELGSRSYTGSVGIKMTSGLATTILADFYGQTATSGPSDTAIPLADKELELIFSSGSERFKIALDQCTIDNIEEPVDVGGGLVVLTFNFTAESGKSNIPFSQWSV